MKIKIHYVSGQEAIEECINFLYGYGVFNIFTEKGLIVIPYNNVLFVSKENNA